MALALTYPDRPFNRTFYEGSAIFFAFAINDDDEAKSASDLSGSTFELYIEGMASSPFTMDVVQNTISVVVPDEVVNAALDTTYKYQIRHFADNVEPTVLVFGTITLD